MNKCLFFSVVWMFLAANSSKGQEEFALIPAGSFVMGSDEIWWDAPTRAVTLDAFYMGKYEVTKARWDEVVAWALNNGYADLKADRYGTSSNHPIHSISWYDMLKWCNARSQKEGLTPVYYINDAQTIIYRTGNVDVTNVQVKWSANGYRLPTEAEWEKAARGGLSNKRFPWGDSISHSQANYYADEQFSYDVSPTKGPHPEHGYDSSPVGSFAANDYGLYDMAGNVNELCWDRYGPYDLNSKINPIGATTGSDRVTRGGSYASFAYHSRVGWRGYVGPTAGYGNYGFRILKRWGAGPWRTQTISDLEIINGKTFGAPPFTITRPSSSSSLPVTLSVKSGPATISGNKVTLTGAGTVVLAANQAGNADYKAAAEVTTSFVVTKATQQITFPPIGNRLHGSEIIALSASASSRLPITYSVISGPAKINGSSLALTEAGSVTIRAFQPGNDNYTPASTSISFNVTPNTSAPTLIGLSRSWFYYNSQVNSIVANLSASDPDRGDKVTYRLVSGTGSVDNSKFTVFDGALRTAMAFDFKSQRSASIRIRATDSLGQYKDQIFNLILVDPNPWAAFELKAPPFNESPSYVNVVFQLRDKERRRINLPQELLDQTGDWFVVSEDGKPITPKESILQVARNEVPLKVRTVLLLDNSNSVGAELETIKSAAKTFVDRMFQTQEIAIYSFSGGSPNLVKNFTAKSAAGQKALKSAIDGIKLGSPSTNLYGSVLAMLQLPKWKESFTLAGIETGCLVVMTDGSDTAGLATLSAAIQKRNSDKKQIFAVGLGADIDPAALNSLQNGDASYTPVLNPTQLAAAFAKIQSIIEDGANNFYWLNYASPKRGNINRKLTIALKNNINGAANRMINTQFNSNGFSSILPGVVINRRVNVASGVTSLRLPINTKITANAFTMLGYKGAPIYTWSVGNSALASVMPIDGNGFQASILSKGLDGATKLTLRDKVNGFTKTIDLIIGTGVAPVFKSANVFQAADLSAPVIQESLAMMKISSTVEATPSLTEPVTNTPNTLKSKEGFSLIPAGAFTMGDSLDGLSDAPLRTVTLDAFYIGKYEVTKAEWDEVRTWALPNGYTDLAAGSGKASNHPVQAISWYDMVKWCNARSQKEGLTPVYYINNAQTTVYKSGSVDVTNAQVKWSASGYRLPTEAEWEKAARGGLSGKRFPWGNTISHSRANYYAYSGYSYDLSAGKKFNPVYAMAGQPYTSPVGSFAPNGYGMYDVAGNVWEWCWDWYGSYATIGQKNPRGAISGSCRVLRGGGWYYGPSICRLAFRYDDDAPSNAFNDIGFRVARSLPAESPRITSDLLKVILTKGKSIAPYAVRTNFLAKNFSASDLPPGLRLQANGVISGTPTKSGTYKVTIVAKKIQNGKVVKSANATKVFEVK